MEKKFETLSLAEMSAVKGGKDKGFWVAVIYEGKTTYLWLPDKNLPDEECQD